MTVLTIIKVKEKMEEILEYTNFAEDFLNYSAKKGIYSVMRQFSEFYVDISNDDLWSWAKRYSNWVEEALLEYEYNRELSIENIFQLGQRLYYEDLIYKELNEIIRYLAYEYLERNAIHEISLKDARFLDKYLEDINMINTIEEIYNIVESVVSVN